jgi:AraC-like DNA-binding protein
MPAKTISAPPLIKLHLAIPFFEELEARGIDTQVIFDVMDLNQELLYSEETFVTAIVMYKLLEKCSEVGADPFLGVVVGEKLDIHAWPLFTAALETATTAADFFTRFIVKSRELASSMEYRLEISGDHALFLVNRVFQPTLVPAQADSFYVGLFANIFSYVLKPVWEPEAVIIRISDPHVVPPRYRKARISKGDLLGSSIQFPVDWLLAEVRTTRRKTSVTQLGISTLVPANFLESIQEALKPFLHIGNLDADRAAGLCGYSSARALNRKLDEYNTTLPREISSLRRQKASHALLTSDKSIAEIGCSVGLSDPSTFTRAFKRWTGLSPTAFRQRNR